MTKMLANPKTRLKFIRGIKKYASVISVLSYVIGIIWMLLLPHHELSARNYFSENQLLPGLVETYFSHNHYTMDMFNDLTTRCQKDTALVKDKIKEEFSNFGFDVYEQHFQVPSKHMNGTNIYGVFRAPRATGVESIILNVPLRASCNSSGSLGLMLGIANYFRDQTFWAKDIIFLVTEHDLYGIQAWLNGYFHDSTDGIRAENLLGHGGSIQAAITIDFPSYFVNHIDILFGGANGLLPNLDFIHVANRIALMEGVPSKLKYQTHLYQHKENYQQSLETLMRMMATQASGYPTGNHGMFYKYRIEALTIHGINKHGGGKQVFFESLGRMIEGIFRSVNNMLEHFHQSFFLYVLPNTYTYISIGLYMPPLGCLILPLVIHLISLWIDIFQLNQEEPKESERVLVTMSALLDGGMLQHLVLSYILCISCYCGLQYYFNNIAYYMPSDYQFFGVVFVSCYGAIIIAGMLQHLQRSSSLSLKLFGVLHLVILIVITSILNFSAAFVIALFYTPLAMIASAPSNKYKRLLQVFLSLLSSPPILLYILCGFSKISLDDSYYINFSPTKILPEWRRIMMDAHFNEPLSIWTKNMFYFTVIPAWITLSST